MITQRKGRRYCGLSFSMLFDYFIRVCPIETAEKASLLFHMNYIFIFEICQNKLKLY